MTKRERTFFLCGIHCAASAALDQGDTKVLAALQEMSDAFHAHWGIDISETVELSRAEVFTEEPPPIRLHRNA